MKNQYANLPSLLKKEGLFCLWQYEVRDGKKTKVPYCVRGYRADPGNKSTFSKFDQVISLANGYDGIGIKPDLEIELDESLKNKNIYKITDAEDNQIQAAIDLIGK